MRNEGEGLILRPISREYASRGPDGPASDGLTDLLRATARHYESAGYAEPWISYLAEVGGKAVGACAFKTVPANGRVEIAYHTFPEYEGRGYATAMARELVAIASMWAPEVIVAAQTLIERNASHRILEKLGFEHVGEAMDDEVGRVWEWRRGREGKSRHAE